MSHGPVLGAFDRALSLQILNEAAEAYASRHGQSGSTAYRAAWLKFRQRIQSLDDLDRLRARAARRLPRHDPIDVGSHH